MQIMGDNNYSQSGQVDQGAITGLPSNIEAEANVLAAMLRSAEVVEEALVELEPDDFYRPSYKTIFVALRDMHEINTPIDSISLIDYLRSSEKLETAGGEDNVLGLMENTLALANWQHHVKIVRRDAMLREIIGATNQINALAYNAPTDTKEVIERAESMLLSVTGREVKSAYRPLSDYLTEAYEEAQKAAEAGGDVHGVPTGFKRMDRMLTGFRPGQLIVVGARPAVGKTSFALNLALNAAAEGYTVGFFSLEMSGKEIAQRLICAQGTINMTNFRTGNLMPQEWANASAAMRDLSSVDILIDDTPGTTVTEIRAKARRMIHNKEKAIIILDYLQLVNSPAGKNYGGNRTVEVSEMSRGLKIMAKELGVPVIILSQLSRAVENRTSKRPQLSDLRESGSIEQDADIVMMLDRSTTEEEGNREDRPPYGVTRVIVAKNRSGPVGDIDLMFLPASTKFYELDETAMP